MSRRIRIEQDSPIEKNAQGDWVPRWVPVLNTPDHKIWASVEDITGREFWNQAQVQMDVTTRIEIREFRGKEITPDMRAVEGETVYHFASVKWLDALRTRLEILAVRVQTNPRS